MRRVKLIRWLTVSNMVSRLSCLCGSLCLHVLWYYMWEFMLVCMSNMTSQGKLYEWIVCLYVLRYYMWVFMLVCNVVLYVGVYACMYD